MTSYNKAKRRNCWLIAIGALVSFNMAASASVDLPTAEQVLIQLGVPQDQRGDLEQGKVISYLLSESTDKELADGLAVYIHSPFSTVTTYVKRGDFSGIYSSITAQATLSDNASADAFKRYALNEDEAQNLLEAEAGRRFNLSAEEIASFSALRDTLKSADKQAVAKAVSQRYREILLQRYLAYRNGGLAGIAPYTRSGSEKADPAAELRSATEHGSEVLKICFPALYQVWINYPQKLPEGVTEQYFWQNRLVENRPTATLTHRLIQTSDTGTAVVIRQFYVGHSYNASQTVVVFMPYRDGTVIFYSLRSSTNQVTGMGSDMKHSIGRNRMKDELLRQLQRMRAILEAK